MTDEFVLIDEPAPGVRRITMNRPEKRNALNHPLRGAILHALREGDRDPSVRVQIVRGAGPSFSAPINGRTTVDRVGILGMCQQPAASLLLPAGAGRTPS